jgi:hypothetical protein
MIVKTWMLLVLVGCGGSAATSTGAPAPVSNTMTPSGSDVHRSRHTVVRKAVAALAAGDVEGLVALASPQELYATHYTCSSLTADQFTAKAREQYTEASSQSKGTIAEVVFIEELKVVKDKHRDESCAPKKSLVTYAASVKVKVGSDDKARERRMDFTLHEVGERWYLGRVPALTAKGGVEAAIEMVILFSDRMCACKDKACADKVNEDYTKWGMEMAKDARPSDARNVSVEDTRRMTEAATRYSECYTKLAMAHQGNP